MSLLLDALKKAADEKKKDSTSVESNKGEIKSSDEDLNDDVDLNLELNQEQGEEFPEVNQEITRQVEIDPIVKNETKEIVEEIELTIETDNEVETETQPENTIQDNYIDKAEVAKEDVDYALDKSKATVADTEIEAEPVEKITPQENSVKDNQPVIKNAIQAPRRQQVVRDEQKRNQDMEALSALINKNNEFRDKKRRIISLSIISTLLLVLLGASLYTYILLDNIDSSGLKNDLVDEIDADTAVSVNNAGRFDRVEEKERVISKPMVKSPDVTKVSTSNQSAVVKPKVSKTVRKKEIQIRKKISEDPIGVLLAQAYAAFKKSEYATSEKLYYKVINRDKNNRDALLGLAAIAVKQGRNENAKEYYKKLLKLDPKDSYAKAGLSALINQKYAQLNESQLKIMLREQPEIGHLHFALGNLMLSQKRFAEAQSSYFKAWSSNKSNSDYAYNLAVSLDHLGKPEHAAEFYKLTVKLFEVSGGNLIIDNVKQRLIQFEGSKQ